MMEEQNKLQVIEARPAPLVSLSSTAMDIAELQQQSDLINQLLKRKMIEATKANNYQGHYGQIPGTKTLSLLKPGAEMIAKMFRLGAEYQHRIEELTGGHINVVVTTKFIHYPTQTVIGFGVGSCSTLESKHRYRTGPVEFTGQPVPREYWDLRKNDPEAAQKLIGGRGYSTKKNPDSGSYEIVMAGQKIDNADPADQWNTALKIAKKRSYVDGIQTLTAAGDIFMINAEAGDDDDQDQPPPPKQNGNGNAQQRSQQTQQSKQTQQKQQAQPPQEAEEDIRCPECGGEMYDNREGNRHATKGPDFRCKDKNCKDEKGYTTCIWRIQYSDEQQDDGPGY